MKEIQGIGYNLGQPKRIRDRNLSLIAKEGDPVPPVSFPILLSGYGIMILGLDDGKRTN